MADTKLSRTRLRIVLSFFLVAFFCLFFRLGFIQLFKSSKYLSLAQNQSRSIIEMQPARGKILDRAGRELALDIRLDSLYAVSREIENKAEVADHLHRILGIDRQVLLEKLSRDKLFVWIARKLPVSQVEEIKSLHLDGLGFVKESRRVYPKSQTACHLIGFTDIDNNGLEGTELLWNSSLKGVPGWRLAQKDAKRRELISKEIEMVAPVDGYNVHLTIDEVIQSFAEKELYDTCTTRNAIGGSIIVMDPATGDILAMANYPMYDLNHFGKSAPEARRNRAVTDIFEPGSVFKIFTLAGILQNKAAALEDTFNCENGSWAVAGRILHDHRGHGVLTLQDIIRVSSNIGTVKAALKLGEKKLYETFSSFGFGTSTGVELSGEVSGILPNPRAWSRSSIINIPIGQGVAVTSLQLASAVTAIANDGVLMKPRFVSYIDDSEGRVLKSFEPQPVRKVLSKETALQVRTVMESVVESGTGRKAAVHGFKAAGKTGTAQKVLPGGGYSHDHFMASFVGFVPYDEPRVVITVSIDEPRPVYYGGEVAAPAFSRLAAKILAYWQISEQPAPPEVSKSGADRAKTTGDDFVPKPAPAAPVVAGHR